jgi:hypothetical protein
LIRHVEDAFDVEENCRHGVRFCRMLASRTAPMPLSGEASVQVAGQRLDPLR